MTTREARIDAGRDAVTAPIPPSLNISVPPVDIRIASAGPISRAPVPRLPKRT